MKIDSPSWQLKGKSCGYCQQGELIFAKCPQCLTVVLICGECGTVYALDGKSVGKENGETTGATRCFSCRGPLHYDFPSASSEEIQALGLTNDDYR